MMHHVTSKDRPIVILSTGRAGSTLLQKLLNTHKELIIWGEHEGILNPLMRSWMTVSQSKWLPETEAKGSWLLEEIRPMNSSKWTAWDGSFSKRDFNTHMKGFLDKLFSEKVPENVRWGFKEIRYFKSEFIDFWSGLYPETQYILLMRNPIDSCLSFTTANASKNAATKNDFAGVMNKVVEKQIRPVFCFFREVMERHENVSHPVIFEKLVEDPMRTLNAIDGFLNLGAKFDSKKVSKMMEEDIVSQRKQTSREVRYMMLEMAKPLLEAESEWFEKVLCSYGDGV